MTYMRARGLRRRGARLLLTLTSQPVLPSTRRRVSALQIISLSTLDTLPTRTATDASSVPSPTPTHGSRGVVEWLLLPSRGLAPPVICQFAWLFSAPKSERNPAPNGTSPTESPTAPDRASTSAPKERAIGRSIPQAIKRQVGLRDQGRCRYRDPVTGRRCTSQHLLQIDHIRPYALGGGADPHNLRLLCAAHHRHRHAARAASGEPAQ